MARKVIGMAGIVVGPTGSWVRRWGILLSLVIAMGAGVVFIRTVLAVHNTDAFELEGDAVSNTTSVPRDDWDRVCHEATGGAECASATNTTGGGGAT